MATPNLISSTLAQCSETFSVDTGGACFICLEKNTGTVADVEGGQEDFCSGDGIGGGVSLKLFARFLNLNWNILCATTSSASVTSLRSPMEEGLVHLCHRCLGVMKEFCDLYRQYDLITIRLNHCVQRVKDFMEGANAAEEKLQEFRKGMMGDPVDGFTGVPMGVEIVENLRLETLAKCKLRTQRQLPNLNLMKVDETIGCGKFTTEDSNINRRTGLNSFRQRKRRCKLCRVFLRRGSNICAHIVTKHPYELFLSLKERSQTMSEYRLALDALFAEGITKDSLESMYSCARCEFKNKERTTVTVHLARQHVGYFRAGLKGECSNTGETLQFNSVLLALLENTSNLKSPTSSSKTDHFKTSNQSLVSSKLKLKRQSSAIAATTRRLEETCNRIPSIPAPASFLASLNSPAVQIPNSSSQPNNLCNVMVSSPATTSVFLPKLEQAEISQGLLSEDEKSGLNLNVPFNCNLESSTTIFSAFKGYELNQEDDSDADITESEPILLSPADVSDPIPKTTLVHPPVKKIRKQKKKSCHVCGRVLANSTNYVKHMRIHTGEKPYNCKYCGNQFRCAGSVKAHVFTCHRDKVFSSCRSPVLSDDAFLQAIKSTLRHHKDRRTCKFCDKTFHMSMHCEIHLVRKHREKIVRDLILYQKGMGVPVPLEPAIPENIECIASPVKNPPAPEVPKSCGICGELFQTSNTLKAHMEAMHRHVTAKRATVAVLPAMSVLKCNFCNQTFFNPDVLKRHTLARHGNNPPPVPPSSEASRESQFRETKPRSRFRINCDICNEIFADMAILKRHKLLHHPPPIKSNEMKARTAKDCTCDFCGKKFSYYESHRVHLLTSHKFETFSKYLAQISNFCRESLEDAFPSAVEKCMKTATSHKETSRCLICSKTYSYSYTQTTELRNHILLMHLKEVLHHLKTRLMEMQEEESEFEKTAAFAEPVAPYVKEERTVVEEDSDEFLILGM